MALNDPQWGRGGGDGPPDLDELWKRLNQRLGAYFGDKGGNGTRPPVGAGSPKGGFGLIAGVLLFIWVASGFYIVDASERGVVLRFGQYLETTNPGPRWHFPFPVESVEVVNVSQIWTVEVGYRNNVRSKVLDESLMLTEDENIVDLQFAVQYIRAEPEKYLFFNLEPDRAVMQVAESAIREIVGKSKMDFVLYEGREQIAANAKMLMQGILDRYQTGISISQVTMQNAQPPEQVQSSFDDAVKANQDRERQINEGEAYANDVVPKAEGTASRLIQEAEAYKQRVMAAAEGEASRFTNVVSEYQRAPRVTRDRLYLDAVQQVLSNATKVFIDQKGNSNLLFLPLDKLMQAGAGSIASSDLMGTSGSSGLIPQLSEELQTRARDTFRGREREERR